MSTAAAEVAREHFGIEPIDALEPLPSHGYAFLVSSSGSRFVLKCMTNWELRPASVKTTHELVRLLNEGGFGTYSLVPAAKGRTWVHDNGLLWEMHTHLVGHTLGSLAYDPSGVGRLLGEYHRTTERLALDCLAPTRGQASSGLESVDPRLPLKALASRVCAAGALREIRHLIDLSFLLVRASASADRVLPLHSDITASNILVSGSRYYLIDFEDTVWGHPCLDVAQALARMLSSRPQGSGCCCAAVHELLSSYAESSGFPPTPADRLRAIAGLQAIRDWACDQLCASLPDESVPGALPSLLCTLSLLSECIV